MDKVTFEDSDGGTTEFHVPSNCLDRAEIALSQTGQVYCAMMMGDINTLVEEISRELGMTYRNNPAIILQEALEMIKSYMMEH